MRQDQPGLGKAMSAAALLFTVTACSVSSQPPSGKSPVPTVTVTVTVTVTRTLQASPSPSATASPSAPASSSAEVAVAGLVVDGSPVASGGQVTVTGPAAARELTGRFTGTAPAGDRFFALTTPGPSAASYVQGEISPAAGGSWSVTVNIGSDTAITPPVPTRSRSSWPPLRWPPS
jgi:hypothetical protein